MRHGPAFCCDESMNEDWSYCPNCGEDIDWPQDPKEVAERQAAHQLRMDTDPHYKAAYESRQGLLRALHEQYLNQFLSSLDPILQRKSP